MVVGQGQKKHSGENCSLSNIHCLENNARSNPYLGAYKKREGKQQWLLEILTVDLKYAVRMKM
jgi:hypothetical protein